MGAKVRNLGSTRIRAFQKSPRKNAKSGIAAAFHQKTRVKLQDSDCVLRGMPSPPSKAASG